MREHLGKQPDEFYFDEGSRMFIRRGDKAPERTKTSTKGKKAEERRPLPNEIASMTLEELASLPYWLVPLDRKEEVEGFKARQRRGVSAKPLATEEAEAVDARLRAGLKEDGSQPEWIGRSNPASPAQRTGPRGGRYTEARTKEGRPYRRYF